MGEQELDADQLNERLDLSMSEGIDPIDHDWLPGEWREVLAADGHTPAPCPDFVQSLRGQLIGQIAVPQQGSRSARHVGIVAFPVYQPKVQRRCSAIPISPKSFLTSSVALVALLLAFAIVNPFWGDGEHRGIGLPTAQASSTAIVATATSTPTGQPTVSTSIGFIAGR